MGSVAARVTGAGLLVASAAIHLDLYLTGYRSIPVIGWLFLLQVIAGFVLALAVLAVKRWWSAAAGACFAIATLGGYLLSIWTGLFGFREVRTTAGIVVGVIEVAAFGVLMAVAVTAGLAAAASGSAGTSSRAPGLAARRLGGVAVPVACVAALGVLVGTVATADGGATATGASATLRTARIGGVTVLTNSRGLTLYLFVPDGTGRSVCYGTCAAYWPPVVGKPMAGTGVTGALGTTQRTNGTLQATYDGHPLYTYIGDSAPGQANGNGLDLNGGLWREITLPAR
jgi:predicted lipoprotein with Yx(FWY)xxD motif